MDFNTLADLRYLFAQFRDGEKLTAACLHHLGDAHQLFAQKKEMEAKHDVIIELAFYVYKRGEVVYTPQIITQGDGSKIYCYVGEPYQYAGGWAEYDYTQSRESIELAYFPTKQEAYQKAFEKLNSWT